MSQRVYLVICFWPCSPSLASSSSFGMTTVRSCMMIDAVMYGMMPSAKTATRRSAPPENRSRNPATPAVPDSKNFWSASRSTPGTGT